MGADATCLSNGDLSTLQYLCRPILQELNFLIGHWSDFWNAVTSSSLTTTGQMTGGPELLGG